MTARLPDADVMLAAVDADPKLSSLAREVAHARGLSMPARITGVDAPTAADAPTYGPTGWSRYDSDDGTVWYVRLPVVLDVAGLPDIEVPPTCDGMTCEIDRDEVIADVVCSLTCERDHDEVTWEIDNIRVQSAERKVEIVRVAWDRVAGVWVTVGKETTRTPVNRDEAERALFAWSDRERKHRRFDPLAMELRDAAVEIIDVDALHDAAVSL